MQLKLEKKGHKITVIDHAKKPAEKIRISGGGRCNFTNKYCTDKNFLSDNKHFCKSALSRYPAENFIEMINSHGISWHEKNKEKDSGQLFCDDKSQQIIDMLLAECQQQNVKILLETSVEKITKNDDGFILGTESKNFTCDALAIATGGPSIPKMGASDFGYKIAKQFGLKVIPTEPALVPLTFTDDLKEMTKSLAGVSIDSVLIRFDSGKIRQEFRDDLLFTHRGLSGPAILQISSYWEAGKPITINLLPDENLFETLKAARSDHPKQKLGTVLNAHLPARFVEEMLTRTLDETDISKNMADHSDKTLHRVTDKIQNWTVKPNGTEGYRTAEVTKGGVDTDELNPRTFESKKVPGLYFIGEVIDVTGHLGGHNFQWAWASGYCCGQEI